MQKKGTEGSSMRTETVRYIIAGGVVLILIGLYFTGSNCYPNGLSQKNTITGTSLPIQDAQEQQVPEGVAAVPRSLDEIKVEQLKSKLDYPKTDILKSSVLELENGIKSQKANGTGTNKVESIEWSEETQLIPGLIAPNVHFMWCGKRWFEFKHYLAINSVIRGLKPDRMIVHYEHPPQMDKLFYNQWMDDLNKDFPFLIMQYMDTQLVQICDKKADRNTKIQIIMEILNPEGGLYIGENTWYLRIPPTNRLVDIEMSLEPEGIDGYIWLRQNMLLNGSYSHMYKDSRYKAKTGSCSTVSQLYNGQHKAACYIVKGGRYDRFYPMDVWELDNAFGRLCRYIFYGIEEIRKPKPSYDELVPNIGHMIWIGGGPMDYVFYLSVLSLLYVVKVDVVYIHGDMEPAGPYWPKLKPNSKVKFVFRQPPYDIYQAKIEPYYRALMSDIIRVDLMIKYGGIYTDTDAIWTKPLSHEDRGYDAVACFDWIDWSYPYPDSVNFGLSYGKKNAPFWRIFRDSMRKLHNDSPGFTGVQMPYKLLEKYPHLLRIDRHLQVICYQQRCHPIWVNDYHNETKDHITMNSIPNFKEDVNAFHWTHPNPVELKDEATLRNSTGVFAELGRYVLEKAGLW